jgi:Glyoxalase-like domain
MHDLDHLLWEEFRLREGEERFTELTGVTPVFGGTHPGQGTHNSLISLGHGKYLELIALDPEQATTVDLSTQAPANFTPRLFAFAVRTYDLNLVKSLIKEAGLEVSGIYDVSRQLPSGEMLNWRSIFVGGHDFGNFMPFFTQCGDMKHPSETSPNRCELLEFSVGHPEYEELSHLYKLLQVNVPVFWSEYPQLSAVLSTPKGKVTLNNREGFVVHQN